MQRKLINIRILWNAKQIWIDGTFKVTSFPFYQFFTIHCLFDIDDPDRQKIYARVLMLLPGKSAIRR